MSPTYLKRPVMISLLLFVVVLLTASIASPTVEENRMTSRNVPYRTHPLVPRVHHPYYVTPQGSCDSFTRPYARSMCLELQRIHRSTTKQPLVYPPPPPPEIDPRQKDLDIGCERGEKRMRSQVNKIGLLHYPKTDRCEKVSSFELDDSLFPFSLLASGEFSVPSKT
ncbi:hypothetical protein Bca52824_072606 [Brassica carinata]|uniref:Uncharacterized protein n=1 Tax=Brassica carinata TaxID=52824 RepID=A0A8X7Q9Z5_BRACI|nr:hypothetical protein Bca52824_072606 [Brassica carinata]